MARFQPALVLTSAQPSITRQLRAVHGSTGTNVTALAKRPQPTHLRKARPLLSPESESNNRSAKKGATKSACGRTSAPTPNISAPASIPRSGRESRTVSQKAIMVARAAKGSVIISAEYSTRPG